MAPKARGEIITHKGLSATPHRADGLVLPALSLDKRVPLSFVRRALSALLAGEGDWQHDHHTPDELGSQLATR